MIDLEAYLAFSRAKKLGSWQSLTSIDCFGLIAAEGVGPHSIVVCGLAIVCSYIQPLTPHVEFAHPQFIT